MAKKHMDFIRKAGGQKAKKLLAVILAAGMAMTALPGETITALAQEAEGQKNVLLAEEVAAAKRICRKKIRYPAMMVRQKM